MSQTGLSVDNSRISPFRETRETFPKRLKTCDRHLSQRRGHRARSGASVAILAGALAREPAPGASKRERSPTSAPRLSPDQRKNPRNSGGFRVRDTGIEPVTSSVSGKRATAAPIAPVEAFQLKKSGGGDGIRTRVNGFAGRCLATRPRHHV